MSDLFTMNKLKSECQICLENKINNNCQICLKTNKLESQIDRFYYKEISKKENVRFVAR